jgi:hypothetical protein
VESGTPGQHVGAVKIVQGKRAGAQCDLRQAGAQLFDMGRLFTAIRHGHGRAVR